MLVSMGAAFLAQRQIEEKMEAIDATCGLFPGLLTWRRLQDSHGPGVSFRFVPAPPMLSATNLNMAE